MQIRHERWLETTLTEAEFKEFEPRFKFKPRLNYGCIVIVSNVSSFKLALNLNQGLADLIL